MTQLTVRQPNLCALSAAQSCVPRKKPGKPNLRQFLHPGGGLDRRAGWRFTLGTETIPNKGSRAFFFARYCKHLEFIFKELKPRARFEFPCFFRRKPRPFASLTERLIAVGSRRARRYHLQDQRRASPKFALRGAAMAALELTVSVVRESQRRFCRITLSLRSGLLWYVIRYKTTSTFYVFK